VANRTIKTSLFQVGDMVKTKDLPLYAPIGTQSQITIVQNGQYQIAAVPGVWYLHTQLELLEMTADKIEQLMKEAMAEAAEYECILDYLKESGKETLVTNEYKVFSALRLMANKKLSEMERVTLIAKLLN
jgi:hypothetical protein